MVCGGARKWIIAVLCMTMPIIAMQQESNDILFNQKEMDKVLRRVSNFKSALGAGNNENHKKVINLEHTASVLRNEDEDKKQKELSDLRETLNAEFKKELKAKDETYCQEIQKKVQELQGKEKDFQGKILEITHLLAKNQEVTEALNNEKNQKVQIISTKDSEIKSLNGKIEELTKKIKEVNSGHAGLLDKYAKKETEYNQVVWHKKLFTAAFLACLVGLIGCVLKIQHVFV